MCGKRREADGRSYCVVIGACTLCPWVYLRCHGTSFRRLERVKETTQQRGRRGNFRPTASRKGCATLSLFTRNLASNTSRFSSGRVPYAQRRAQRALRICQIDISKITSPSPQFLTPKSQVPNPHHMYVTNTTPSSQARVGGELYLEAV